jgi:hypothetical protein
VIEGNQPITQFFANQPVLLPVFDTPVLSPIEFPQGFPDRDDEPICRLLSQQRDQGQYFVDALPPKVHAYSEIADALPLTNPEPEEELDEHGWRVRHVGVMITEIDTSVSHDTTDMDWQDRFLSEPRGASSTDSQGSQGEATDEYITQSGIRILLIDAEENMLTCVSDETGFAIESVPRQDVVTRPMESMIQGKGTAMLIGHLTDIDTGDAHVAIVDVTTLLTSGGLTDITTVQVLLPTVKPMAIPKNRIRIFLWKLISDMRGEAGATPDGHLQYICNKMSTPPGRCDAATARTSPAELAQAIDDAVNLSSNEVLEGIVGSIGSHRGIFAVDNYASAGIVDISVDVGPMQVVKPWDQTYIGGFGGKSVVEAGPLCKVPVSFKHGVQHGYVLARRCDLTWLGVTLLIDKQSLKRLKIDIMSAVDELHVGVGEGERC